MCRHTYSITYNHINRQTDRSISRLTYRHTVIHAYITMNKHTNKYTYNHTKVYAIGTQFFVWGGYD